MCVRISCNLGVSVRHDRHRVVLCLVLMAGRSCAPSGELTKFYTACGKTVARFSHGSRWLFMLSCRGEGCSGTHLTLNHYKRVFIELFQFRRNDSQRKFNLCYHGVRTKSNF